MAYHAKDMLTAWLYPRLMRYREQERVQAGIFTPPQDSTTPNATLPNLIALATGFFPEGLRIANDGREITFLEDGQYLLNARPDKDSTILFHMWDDTPTPETSQELTARFQSSLQAQEVSVADNAASLPQRSLFTDGPYKPGGILHASATGVNLDESHLMDVAARNLSALGTALESNRRGKIQGVELRLGEQTGPRLAIHAKGEPVNIGFLARRSARDLEENITEALVSAGLSEGFCRLNAEDHTVTLDCAIFRSPEKFQAFTQALTQGKAMPEPANQLPDPGRASIDRQPPSPGQSQNM